MKSKYRGLVLVLLFLLALLAGMSCKGVPPVEETPPASGPTAPSSGGAASQSQGPDGASLDALNAAAARAEAARKMAADFEGEALFPSDWEAADSLFAQAERQRDSSTTNGARDSAARYNAAADAFDALTAKTIARYYEEAEAALTEARNSAVNAGANTYAPDFLLDADNAVAGAYEKYQAKDYYAAKDAAWSALSMYEALTAGLEANAARQEIADRGFEAYDPQNVQSGDNSLSGAVIDYYAGDYAAAGEKAKSALAVYTTALNKGWESYAAERAAAAAAARQRALDVKANVAVRQEFDTAQAAYAQANAAFGLRDFSAAAQRYDRCESMFTQAADTALEKRLTAEEALRLANEKMAESDETAKNAEIILEGSLE